MRAVIASILLFVYALTCIGATVNMHRCHGRAVIALQEQEREESPHDSCPLCRDHETQTPHTCGDDGGSGSCCKDVQFVLKKAGEDAESVQSAPKLPLLSPVVVTLAWISVFHPGIEANAFAFPPDRISDLSPPNPAYVLHRNFRI